MTAVGAVAAPPPAAASAIPPATPQREQVIKVGKVYLPLFERDEAKRYRYYVYYGGRDAGKSWSVATALVSWARLEPLRILCTREIQRTIADSVHRLLADTIKRLEVEHEFEITDNSIACRLTGAEFLFVGLRDQDVHKMKSYEGVDLVWVEEAHTVTDRSWTVLVHTIRREGSEIWITFNPELDTDATYQRFVVRGAPRSFAQKVTWRDNPWPSAVLEAERERMRREDPAEFDNVYEGNPRTAVVGAIYSKEVAAMVQGGRIQRLPYDPKLLVHAVWDLGWNDQTTIVFAQRLLSEVRVIDYEEQSFVPPDEWAMRLKAKRYNYGGMWLPHDADHQRLEARGVSFREQIRPLLPPGIPLHIVPRVNEENDRIRAARMMFPRVYMDSEKCARLLECLKRFRRAVPRTTGEEGDPVKDEFKHGADAFGQMAMVVDKFGNERQQKIVVPARRMANPRVGY
jgi:phage terminase large subunit